MLKKQENIEWFIQDSYTYLFYFWMIIYKYPQIIRKTDKHLFLDAIHNPFMQYFLSVVLWSCNTLPQQMIVGQTEPIKQQQNKMCDTQKVTLW
jgi:hypothetical protein